MLKIDFEKLKTLSKINTDISYSIKSILSETENIKQYEVELLFKQLKVFSDLINDFFGKPKNEILESENFIKEMQDKIFINTLQDLIRETQIIDNKGKPFSPNTDAVIHNLISVSRTVSIYAINQYYDNEKDS